MAIKPAHLLLIFRCCFVLAISIVTYASLVEAAELPPIAQNVWDKLQHASAFLLLSFLLHQCFPEKRFFSLSHIAQLTFLVCYGIMIEWLQSYSATRYASVGDVVADVVGVLCYTLLYFKKYNHA